MTTDNEKPKRKRSAREVRGIAVTVQADREARIQDMEDFLVDSGAGYYDENGVYQENDEPYVRQCPRCLRELGAYEDECEHCEIWHHDD